MAARRKLKVDADQLCGFCRKVESFLKTPQEISAIELRQNELERRFDKLVDSRDAFYNEPEDESKKDADAASAQRYEEACEAYLAVRDIISKLITQHAEAEVTQHNISMMQSQNNSLRLPTVNVPIFEGGYSKWPVFRDLFEGIFKTLTPGQKLAHLHDRTKGEAHDIVVRFEVVDANFELAWNALGVRYGNPRILVHQQMKKLFGTPSAQSESPRSLRLIQSSINDSLAIFKSYKIKVENWDPILIHLCSSKIPEDTLKGWEDSLTNHKELPTWEQMDAFLSNRIEKLETVQDFKKPNQRENHHSKSQAFHSQADTDEGKEVCKKCKQDHSLRNCSRFKALSVNDRIKFAMSSRYCLNCLLPDHFKPNCKSRWSCRICHKKHHTLLHLGNDSNQHFSRQQKRSSPQDSGTSSANANPSSTPPSSANRVENINAHFAQSEGTTILPTALVYIEHAGELFSARALLDNGSEKSFLSAKIQQRLAIPLENHSTQISGLGGTVVSNSRGRCNLLLKSRNSNFKINIKAIVIPKLSQFLPSRPVKISNMEQIQRIPLADPYFFKPAQVDIIIGSDFLPFINLQDTQMFEGCLEARDSHFGWYLNGPEPANPVSVFSTSVQVTENIALHEQLKQFWNIEEVDKPKPQSENDVYCEQLYRSTTVRESDGKYVVRLPFKEEYPAEVFLGPSKYMALAQYSRMEKTLEKSPDLKMQYHSVLQEYEDLGHMEQQESVDQNNEKVSCFFLPHHAVIRPESQSTKVRVVFNASKKTKSGFSLNDALHTGPILQADLLQVITNWRFYRFVFTGDIQKMYRQIWVHKDDRAFQQILFRRSPDQSIKTFQLKTVTFGINCAPFLAIRTLHELSKDVEAVYPDASFILKNEIYVDDILSGGHSIENAKTKQIDLIKALDSAGFPTKKVTANDHNLLDHLPREDLLDEEFLKLDTQSITKTLGVQWNALADSFSYAVQDIEIRPSTTKRQMLSTIAKLFDPLGWIGPVIIVAKMFMQELWELKSEWDEEVPPHLLGRWNGFLQNLPDLSKINIPRWVNFSTNCSLELHGFCDASEKGYCGTVYLRTTNQNGDINSHLLVAKTRVAPIKRTTIPKLELCGAALLTKLITNLANNFNFQYEVFLWTDSAIVLGWLQKSPQTLKTFVANRVGEILSTVSVSQWKHVKSNENPADLGSRGCSPRDLEQNPLWWHGPAWLQLSQEQWPKPRSFEPTELETKTATFFTEASTDDIISRFSSLDKCLKGLSYMFRLYNYLRGNPIKFQPFVDAEEIEFVKKRLIAAAQKSTFNKEIDCLKRKIPISRKSSILTLNPFLDEDELLRVGGRLTNSELSFNEKHPIIIPAKSHFAELLVNFTHQILLHSEFNIMIRAIRQGYYIPRLKNLIRNCIRSCKQCTIYKHKFQQQIMAALPPERVKFSLPFTYTGVDFAGPFNLKSSSLRNAKIIKGYAAVFVCFSTKAVHLETCSDLSTEAFIATFTRFTGRRGLPKTMFSDNGRNFLGASSKLLKEHHQFLQATEKALSAKHSVHGFNWSFIPPYSPHMGGLWEAAVKSMKTHLKKISTNVNYTFEEFTTLLVRVEAILNSRPLSPMSQNPQELLPLTPGHFLRGAPIISAPDGSTPPSSKSLSHHNRWEKLKAIQKLFAHRWKNEYITELQRRYKWKTAKANLKEDDLVVVKEDFLPATEWRLGRIIKLHPGKDQNIRVADVRTQNGIITSSKMGICRLCRFCHHEKYCPAFKAMSPDSRRQAAIRYKLCLNCLAQTHLREDCPSNETCRTCSARHYSMIHRPRPEEVLNTSFEKVPESTRIWPLVQGILVFKTKKVLANLLLDPKTECSFVTRDVLKKILERQQADARIPSIRLALSVPNAPWVSIEGIYDVKEYYQFSTQHPIHDQRLTEHLSILQPIANPCLQEKQVIDGVIGKNLLKELKVKSDLNPKIEPVDAVATKFGWVVSGHWAGCEDDHLLKRQLYKLDLFSAGGGC